MLSTALWLASAHVKHPRYVPRYVANLRVPPIESGLPWFTFAATDFLESWVKPHHSVFEYGCGGSTLFFAARARSVECVEHNARWCATTMAALAQRKLGNVFIRQEPAGREPPLADSSYCRALDRPFAIVVVDGWALGKHTQMDRRAVMSRAACFARAEEFARPGSIIVLDDAWFDLSLKYRARERRSFTGVGPWRIGASRTDVFFY